MHVQAMGDKKAEICLFIAKYTAKPYTPTVNKNGIKQKTSNYIIEMKSTEKQTLFLQENSKTIAELEPLTIISGDQALTPLPQCFLKKKCPSNWDFLMGMTGERVSVFLWTSSLFIIYNVHLTNFSL